jgi:multidrug efflux pump subunit AcrB
MRGFGDIFDYFVRHRTAANLVMVLMLALGIAATQRIRSQYFPDVIVDSIDVDVVWDGAGPEDIDSGVVAVLEPALLAVDGVAESSSRSTEGRAEIELEFEPGHDMVKALDDVAAAVEGAGSLPDGIDPIEISRSVWRDRVTDLVIWGPVGREQLGRLADEMVAMLFQRGITRVSVLGIAAPGVTVEVSEAALVRHDVTLREIADAIGGAAAPSPAGELADGTARVRTGSERREVADIAGIVVRTDDDGRPLTVGDVARVSLDPAEAGRSYFVGEAPAVTMRVDRPSGGDAIGMQAAVEDAAAELRRTLPAGTEVALIRSQAEQISDRLDLMIEDGLQGLALVVAFLFLFLSARTALWVSAGIPVAVAGAIGVMYVSGLTLNMMSLFALIICIGILVDDSIVVSEHADYRHRHLGEDPYTAASNAARRMAMPVLAATVTMVIGFLGLVAIGGRFGSLIAAIPFTVAAVLLVSLVECFLILPNHLAHAMQGADRQSWFDAPSRWVNRGFDWFRARAFRPFVALVVRLRYPVLAGAILALSLAVGLFLRGDVTWRFFDAPEQPSISGNIAMLPGATRADTLEMIRELQRAVDAVAARYAAEHGANPVEFALAEVGGNTGRAIDGSDTKDPDQLGGIAIELIDPDLRPYSSFTFLEELQQEVRNHPKLETLSFRGWRAGPGGDALDVRFYGGAATELKAAAEALKAEVARFPEVSAVEDSLAYDKDEHVLELTPLGHALGLTIDGIGAELRQRLNGITAAEFPDGSRTLEVRVEAREDEVTSAFLQDMRVRTSGGWLPLSDLVTVAVQPGFSSVERENGLRVVRVTGDISGDDAARAAAILAELESRIVPEVASRFGAGYDIAGLSEDEDRFLSDAMTGLILCLLGNYLCLSWMFASWFRPLIIMSAIPFGLVGAILGHWHWGVAMSMFSVVGLIGMTGIIINDSIVLIDAIDEEAGRRGFIPAVIHGTAGRLRAVMLTSVTTVLGTAPLLFQTSSQALFLKPTVITLAYGLGFGTVLVLLVVPALAAVQHDLERLFRSARRAPAARRAGRLRGLALAAMAGSAAVLAATVGHWAVTGTHSAPVSWLAAGTGLGGDGALPAIVAMLAGIATVLAAALLAGLVPGRDRGPAKARRRQTT